MMTAIGIYLFAFATIIILMMAVQYLRGTHDLLSVRNFALLGLIVFQVTSVGIRMFTNDFSPLRLWNPATAAAEFTLWITLFFLLLLLAYSRGWGVRAIAARVPVTTAVPSGPTLLAMAVLLTLISMPLRFAVTLPAIGILADAFGVGFAAIACGLAAWVWAPRLFNPIIIVIALVIIVVNLITVMTGVFGRRQIIAVLACVMWAMYYAHWRSLPPLRVFTRLALISVPAILFVAVYTSVRSAAEHGRTAEQHLQRMTSVGDATTGLLMMLDGQGAGVSSLWLIENYPERYSARPLFMPFYALAVMIPREVWPGKPEPISTKIARQSAMTKVNVDRLKVSPGIIGHAAAEGGWYAVIIYGLLAGLFLRFFDELTLRAPYSPFVVLPVGSALGQVVGFARGDTSTMANIYAITVAGTWLAMIAVGKIVEHARGARGLTFPQDDDSLTSVEHHAALQTDDDSI